jgi:two-component system, chemotaxis family, CheB/CheR fusion protein
MRGRLGLSPRDIGRQVQDLELSNRPLELRSRLDSLYTERHPVPVRGVEWRRGADTTWFDVFLHPMINRAGVLEGTSVTFVDVTSQHRLQDELQGSRVQLETAYEELQSAVEELETTNEELQSTNEELETTNEELQSTNEELETINDELRQRTSELNEINNCLEAVLRSLNSAVVVVDRDVRIQVWSRHAQELWGLRSDEVEGEHLMNLDIGLPVERLHQPIRAGLAGEPPAPIAMPAVNRRGRAIDCSVRITSLVGTDDEVVGVILLMDAHDSVTGPDALATNKAPPERSVAGAQGGYVGRRLVARRASPSAAESRAGGRVRHVDLRVCDDAGAGIAEACPSSCAFASTGTSTRSMRRSSGCSRSFGNDWRPPPARL